MKIYKKYESFIKNILLPVLIFAFLTVIFNFAIVKGFSSQIERNDGRLLAWTLAWDNHKLLTDPTSIFQANIFYPNENTLTYSEHAFAISLLSLPAYLISDGNPVIGFNFVMLLCYFLNAFTSYLLVKYLTKSRMAGIVGGIVFGFCSYKILNFGHLQNMPVFYMPIMLLLVYKYFEGEKKIKYLVGIGLCLLLQSLSSWYHMVFIFILFGVFMLYFIYKKKLEKFDLARFAVMLIVVFAMILPFALPYLKFNKENASAYNINELKTYSSDFGGYFLPSPNTLEHEVISRLNIKKINWQENFNYVGYVALLLSLLSFVKIENKKPSFNLTFSKSKGIFIITGLLFMMLSFGPFLRFADTTTKIPLLYLIMYKLLPPIRFIRAVARFSTVVYLMLGILAGFGLLQIFKKLNYKPITYVVFVIVSALIALEYFPYHDYREFEDVSEIPAVYETIKNDDDVKAIVEYPMNVGPFITTGYVYYAGYHLKPLVNGYSGYQPKDYPTVVDLTSAFPDSIGLFKLKDMGVSHVLINPTYEEELDLTFLELEYEDGGYSLYKIKDSINEFKFYYDNFVDTIENKPGNVEYVLNDTIVNKASTGTPVANISPDEIDKKTTLVITTQNEVDKLYLKFRTFGEDDSLKISCDKIGNYSFSNTSEYVNNYIELDCDGSEINFEFYSSEYIDRSMITSIGLLFK